MILVLITIALSLAVIIIYHIGNRAYKSELIILDKKEYKLQHFMSIGLYLIKNTPLKKLAEKPHYQILQLYSRQSYKERTIYFEAERLTLTILIIMGSFLIGTILFIKSSMIHEVNELSKNQFNSGSYTKQLYYEVISEDEIINDKLTITVPERYPNQSQKEDIFKSLKSKLPTLILNGNTSLEHVVQPLNLIETYYDEQIKIIWESTNEKLLLNNGEIRYNNLEEEGEKVVLNADIDCYGIKERVSYTIYVFNKVLDDNERRIQISDNIKKQLKQSISESTEEMVNLPKQDITARATIKWFNGDKNVSVIKILIGGGLFGILIYYLKLYELKVRLKTRKEELLKEFPACINKLTLLINAGMTFKRAWEKVVNDYIKLKPQRGSIILYEEMLTTLEDINKGMPEIKAYEAFGQICQIPEVLRFVALVIQNIKKGSNLLINAMQQQSKEALSLRQDLARKKGEKASTKLIFPMGIMFLAILIIIITPAIITLKL